MRKARLACCAALAFTLAGTASAQTPPSPQAQDHKAHVDRFLAALPPAGDDEEAKEDDDRAERDIAALVEHNPGKEAAIRAAIEGREKCSDAKTGSFAMDSLRASAEMLSDAELESLTTFYSGPDYARFAKAGENSPEAAEMLKRYPLARFMEVTGKVLQEMTTKAIDAFFLCDTKARDALAAAGVKTD